MIHGPHHHFEESMNYIKKSIYTYGIVRKKKKKCLRVEESYTVRKNNFFPRNVRGNTMGDLFLQTDM